MTMAYASNDPIRQPLDEVALGRNGIDVDPGRQEVLRLQAFKHFPGQRGLAQPARRKKHDALTIADMSEKVLDLLFSITECFISCEMKCKRVVCHLHASKQRPSRVSNVAVRSIPRFILLA
jgi:hypothetical protein